jgi:pimeloyl-ACP methyl ester carboxylesterase
MAAFEDRHWTSDDGLRLHFRDYPGAANSAPVLCLPGLTRNARDFETFAPRIAGARRVLCLDMRGRGDSDYARDPMSYAPASYFGDIEALLAQEGIARFVAVGTSLGGLLTMLLAARNDDRVTAAVINDIGPELGEQGLARIRSHVGQGRSFETWMHAARALQDANGAVFPDFGVAEWLVMAKRVMTLGSNGRIVFDYDMKIAEPFAAGVGVAGLDLWPMWRALAGRPVLLLRGETSDILAAEVAARMIAEVPDAELVTLPRVGHAPTLDEPEAIAAIGRLLARAA